MFQVMSEHIQKIHDLRLPVHECQHDDSKRILELGVLVELV